MNSFIRHALYDTYVMKMDYLNADEKTELAQKHFPATITVTVEASGSILPDGDNGLHGKFDNCDSAFGDYPATSVEHGFLRKVESQVRDAAKEFCDADPNAFDLDPDERHEISTVPVDRETKEVVVEDAGSDNDDENDDSPGIRTDGGVPAGDGGDGDEPAEWEFRAEQLVENGVFSDAPRMAQVHVLSEKGWKQEQIAEELGISQPDVSKQASSARERIREAIWQAWNDETTNDHWTQTIRNALKHQQMVARYYNFEELNEHGVKQTNKSTVDCLYWGGESLRHARFRTHDDQAPEELFDRLAEPSELAGAVDHGVDLLRASETPVHDRVDGIDLPDASCNECGTQAEERSTRFKGEIYSWIQCPRHGRLNEDGSVAESSGPPENTRI